jgi:hypothetical protein
MFLNGVIEADELKTTADQLKACKPELQAKLQAKLASVGEIRKVVERVDFTPLRRAGEIRPAGGRQACGPARGFREGRGFVPRVWGISGCGDAHWSL